MTIDFQTALLSPFDTLFFRDHRPFEAGGQKYARPLFPTPMTFMGALSNAYFDRNPLDKQNFIKKGAIDSQLGGFDPNLSQDGTSAFCIKGLFVVKDAALYAPMPAHFLCKKSSRYECRIKAVFPEEKGRMKPPEDDFEYKPGFIRLRHQFLKTEFTTSTAALEDPFEEEKRVGIAIDAQTNSTEEGALYFTPHMRPSGADLKDKTSFLVGYQTVDRQPLNMSEVCRLGGENRMVHAADDARKNIVVENLNLFVSDLKKELRASWNEENQGFRFGVYLLTPAIFEKGWQPGAWPWQDRAELVAACVPKETWVSGFKITKGRGGHPRPLYRAAPAGSVYFFQSEDTTLKQELIDSYILNRSVSEIYPQAGFGMTLLFPWQYES